MSDDAGRAPAAAPDVEGLAAAVRDACIAAAVDAWEDGGIRGLCGEGRWEYAISAMRKLDLTHVIRPPAG